MKTTRLKTFETNSSSSHSIVLNNSKRQDTLYVDPETKTVTIQRHEFGWGYEDYSDAYAKAAYALQDTENDERQLEQVKAAIKEVTGAENVELIGEGYSDHQSYGTFIDAQPANLNLREWARDFIFFNYDLVIDNDNH